MHWNVVFAKYLGGYRLAVTFVDGTSGEVDLARRVRAGGVFARISDVNSFKQFTINPDFGTICWGTTWTSRRKPLLRGRRRAVPRHAA